MPQILLSQIATENQIRAVKKRAARLHEFKNFLTRAIEKDNEKS